jgi:hypothetical protein
MVNASVILGRFGSGAAYEPQDDTAPVADAVAAAGRDGAAAEALPGPDRVLP